MTLSLLLSVIATVLSLVSIGVTAHLYRRELSMTERHYLTSLWNGILDLSHSNPRYIDIAVTEKYRQEMTSEELIRYDMYCLKAWGHAQEVIEHGDDSGAQFKAALQWMIAFHLTWLEDNSAHFFSDKFWKVLEERKNSSALVLRHRNMPTCEDGEINWDEVGEDYFEYVLSPMHPVMIEGDDPRNGIVNEITAIAVGWGTPISLGDFGCGIGTLFPHLRAVPNLAQVFGVERSEASLRIATETAHRNGLPFTPIHDDIRGQQLVADIDIAVAVNSVLPSERREVGEILSAVFTAIRPGGWLVAIFPSFDTTQYLMQLWRNEYHLASGSEVHGNRVMEALIRAKKVDTTELKYADDGRTQQCYHTPASLQDELGRAGFLAPVKMEKIYYPWHVTRKFDYGYFPDAPEEIWDWLVVARKP